MQIRIRIPNTANRKKRMVSVSGQKSAVSDKPDFKAGSWCLPCFSVLYSIRLNKLQRLLIDNKIYVPLQFFYSAASGTVRPVAVLQRSSI